MLHCSVLYYSVARRCVIVCQLCCSLTPVDQGYHCLMCGTSQMGWNGRLLIELGVPTLHHGGNNLAASLKIVSPSNTKCKNIWSIRPFS